MTSLKTHLYNKVKFSSGWVPKSVLTDFARTMKYDSENAGRRLRELAKEGKVEHTLIDGYSHYRTKERQIVPAFAEKVQTGKLL